MKTIYFDGWKIEEITAPLYRARNDRYTIVFYAEYIRGVYAKIKNVYDEKTGRNYTAWRYLTKYAHIAQRAAFELLKAGKLYDYNNNVPALTTYKKDIAAYYKKCVQNNLPLYGDEEFLKELFKDGGGL